MNRKLTLSLKAEIIEKAKAYAKEHNTSLSQLVENYFDKLTADLDTTEDPKGSIVDMLGGIISLDDDFDEKREWKEHLIEKHK